MKRLKINWLAVREGYQRTRSAEETAAAFRININALKSRIRREGWAKKNVCPKVKPLVTEAAILMQRRNDLAQKMDQMAMFLRETGNDVLISGMQDTGAIYHLNMRLFLQVHVTNVVEASQAYDQSVSVYMAARSEQRN